MSNNNILYLESLTKKYDTLLIQYNQSITDYASYTNQNQNNVPTQKDLVVVDNAVIISSGQINSSSANTLEECRALCSSQSNCRSATFNSGDFSVPQCWLNTDAGTLTSAPESNNYAILSKKRELLMVIKTLNTQLMDVNNEILEVMEGIKDNKKLYNKITFQRFDLFNKLNDNLKDLKLQRIKVLDEIDQYESLDQQQNYTTLSTNKSYYTFIILFLVVCIIVFILTKIVLKTNFESVGGLGLLITIFFIVTILSLLIYLNKR